MILFIKKLKTKHIINHIINYHNNKMNILPNEITLTIFDNIKLITDKRQFLRTCINYNNMTKRLMQIFEENYSVKHFGKITEYCVEKFTLELCHDSYFDMIPMSYITKNNTIIVKAASTFNCVKLLEMAKLNNCDFSVIYCSAAVNGNVDIIKWAVKNGYKWDTWTCTFAATCGQPEIIKWANKNGFDNQDYTFMLKMAANKNNVVY